MRCVSGVPTTNASEAVLFPRLTDDGFSFYDDRYISTGGSAAWFQNLNTAFSSKVLQRVGGHLAATTVFATLVALAFGASRQGWVPEEVGRLIEATSIPLFPHEAVGSFIGLLLAFRTSQSYDRFWEARTLWGARLVRTRTLAVVAVRAPLQTKTLRIEMMISW